MKLFVTALAILAIALPSFAQELVGKAVVPTKLKVKEGDAFLDFDVTDMAGMKFNTADVRKDKAVVILFVRDPNNEMRDLHTALSAFTKQFADKAIVLEVALKGEMTQFALAEFYEKAQLEFTPVLDCETKAADAYGIGMPHAIIVANKDGVITTIVTERVTRVIKGLSLPGSLFRAIEEGLSKEAAPAEKK